MPAGSSKPRPSFPVIERMTALACLEIARQVQRSRQLAADPAGAEAARMVARLIEHDLLAARPSLRSSA